MNKIDAPGVLWLASDIHLGPASPATTEAFIAFLDTAAQEASAVLLPGDIFDAWIGDDVIRAAPPWLASVLAAFKRVSAQTTLWIGRGNRDFLMGQELADAIGARLLPDQVILQTDAGRVLLSHGDEFCTDDTAYQQFRAMVRQPEWQQAFLAKPIPERLAAAQQARGESMAATQTKAAGIMDVNPKAIRIAFETSEAPLMVHGHTHRPDRHVLMVEGKKRERWVLPDWDLDHATPSRGGWMVIDGDGIQSYDLDPAETGQPAGGKSTT
ncbi:MAG: UDP-2,3-diacylglucosamine diphosphatase [Burkholderiaceae bacterium]